MRDMRTITKATASLMMIGIRGKLGTYTRGERAKHAASGRSM
jgi:hypothetical protein